MDSTTVFLATETPAMIHPSLNSIMIGHTFTTLLVPLFIALFYFSNEHSRRTPIFVLNVIVVVLAFITGVLIDSLAVSAKLRYVLIPTKQVIQDPYASFSTRPVAFGGAIPVS